MSLLLSALFLDYFAGSVRRRVHAAIYAVPAALVVAALLAGEALAARIRIVHLVLVQITYTSAATLLYMNPREGVGRRPRHLVYLLAGMWAVHAVQMTRVLQPGVGWIFDAVPLAGAAFILGLTVLVLTDSRTLRAYTHEPDLSPGPSGWTLERLDELMRQEKPFLDAQLKVETLARAAGVSARELSRLINARTGASFYDYVNRHRVAEAQHLLLAPDESATSVEAIGLLVGFKARSTFYEAFRRVNGCTPAEYRRAHQGA